MQILHSGRPREAFVGGCTGAAGRSLFSSSRKESIPLQTPSMGVVEGELFKSGERGGPPDTN